MKFKSTVLVFGLTTMFAAHMARADDTADPHGIWIANDGKAHVKVDTCGENICGTVVWIEEPIDPDTGKPKLDKRNTDKSLQSRPVMGMKMFDMALSKDKIWRGAIYNGADGNTYDATLKMSDDELDVQGCVFFGILCKTQTWTRFKE